MEATARGVAPPRLISRKYSGLPGVLEMHTDTHLDRTYVRSPLGEHFISGTYARWIIFVLTYEVVGVGFGLVALRYFAKYGGIGQSERVRKQGWPEVAGMSVGTSIMGSALSFLLIFRLSWSFGRWWEARGLIGTAMTKIRNLASMICANKTEPMREDVAALTELRLVSKLHFATMVDILITDPDLEPAVKKSRAARATRNLVAELAGDEIAALGEERARMLSTSPMRVLLCHSWLAHAIRICCERKLLRDYEQDSALDAQNGLLQCYYASMKIKTTPMPNGILYISLIVRFVYCLVIFPQFLAYAFVMKLTQEQQELKFMWDKGGKLFIPWYILITSVMIAFFTVIHIVALELDDPYGEDGSDLPLEKMRRELWADLDGIADMCEQNHNLGGGTGLTSFVKNRGALASVVSVVRDAVARPSEPARGDDDASPAADGAGEDAALSTDQGSGADPVAAIVRDAVDAALSEINFDEDTRPEYPSPGASPTSPGWSLISPANGDSPSSL